MPYEEGQAIPPGYELNSMSRARVAWIGGAVFLLGYLPAIYAAALLGLSRVENGIEALYAPVVGPFLAIETIDAEGQGIFWLMLLGVTQTGGAVTAIVGLALPDKKQLVRMGDSSGTWTIAPTPGGLSVVGSF